MRVGVGYDAHALAAGRKLILGGVEVPHVRGLLGHSDADVALHALCDALLGAAALGDIGGRFPDTDAEYRDISSLILLERVREALEEKGGRPLNVDLTVVAQKPKLAPYVAEMRSRIAACLGLPLGAVSVKATTTERLGFAGREEGIAAYAVCTIESGDDT
ncbi:MAG: 2-C-methyl-D-erythritol 2,4-cyclodiphosphate synthase [Nitrospinota bacterium]